MMDVDFYRFDPMLFWRIYTDVLFPLDAYGVFGLSKFSSEAQDSCKSQPFGCEVYDYGAVVPQELLAEIVRARDKLGSIFPVLSAFQRGRQAGSRPFSCAENFDPNFTVFSNAFSIKNK